MLHSQHSFALLTAVALFAAGTNHRSAQAQSAAEVAALNRRIGEMFPTAKEKRFDEIGWAKELRDAMRLAKEHNRPVFLFSNVGQMDIGRC